MTDNEIVQTMRLCLNTEGDCRTCSLLNDDQCVKHLVVAATDLIERLTAENAALLDGDASVIEALRKELEWKDMVISLAQRKQAEAEAERDALLGKWMSVDDELPAPGTRVIATDGVFVGEAIFARDSRWSGYDGGILRDCIGSVVTHWIPLPPVPKKGEQNAWKSETES